MKKSPQLVDQILIPGKGWTALPRPMSLRELRLRLSNRFPHFTAVRFVELEVKS